MHLPPVRQPVAVKIWINRFCGIAHGAHEVVDPDGIALRAVSGGIVGGVADFRVAALATCAMDIDPDKKVCVVAEPAPEGNIGRRASMALPVGVGGAAPVVAPVEKVFFVSDGVELKSASMAAEPVMPGERV